MAYLDENGLEHFWGKIKDRVSLAVAPKANDADVVHKTGDETVEGLKVFSDTYINPETGVTASDVAVQDSVISKGTVPEKRHYISVVFTDSSGVVRSNENRLAVIEYVSPFEAANACGISLACYNFLSNSDEFSRMFVGYDSNLTPFATAPETSELRNGSYDILTRSWIPKDTRIVHTTGDEAVSGNKLFNDTVVLKTSAIKGTIPATTKYKSIVFTDSNSTPSSFNNETRFSQIRATISSAGSSLLEFFAFKNEAGSSDSTRISVGYDSNGNAYAIAPSTSSSRSNGGDIVTRDWIPSDTRIVHTAGSNVLTAYDFAWRDNDASGISISGGSAAGKGARLVLCGKSHGNNPGQFILHANNDNGSDIKLVGNPSGTLSWNGQTIQTTSDERLKTTLSEVPDAVLDAWEEVNWGQFQYLDAVASKGESARLHLGLIAQHVMSVFGKHGLDACDYGILCHEERPAVDEEETIVDAEAYVDEEGVEHPAVTHVETRHEDAVDLWMVRYAEAQAMETCCVRRENARLKKRIAGLEERLAALELKIS